MHTNHHLLLVTLEASLNDVFFPQTHRNLSQLPNFAFSVPLAMFHSESEEGGGVADTTATNSDERLQEALIMFPTVRYQSDYQLP